MSGARLAWATLATALLALPAALHGQSERPRAETTATRLEAADSLALQHLGERLFRDPRLSANGQISCASCHQPDRAFTDGLSRATGIHGRVGTRNTPTLLNVGSVTSLFWDGRRDRLETQALDPLINPTEHGLTDANAIVEAVEADPAYVAAFAKIFDDSTRPVQASRIGVALASFQRSLIALDAPFDRFRRTGRADAMPDAAQRGFALFEGRAQCSSCHLTTAEAHLADGRFHSLAVGLKRIEPQLGLLTKRVLQLRAAGQALDHAVTNDADLAELGRFLVTLDPKDIGAFRTPTLRNVAQTAPYMHDGSVPTLEAAVDLELYYRGARDGRPLVLSPQERADLVAFMHALTSPTENSSTSR